MATLIILAIVIMLVAALLVAGGVLDSGRRVSRRRDVAIEERPVRRVRRAVVEDVEPVVTRRVYEE